MATLAVGRRIVKALAYDADAAVQKYDGLSAFAPMWAIAMIFSIAGDPYILAGQRSLTLFVVMWAQITGCVLLLVKPKLTWAIAFVSLMAVIAYALRLPVASNNKTISTVMNLSILLVMAVAARQASAHEPLDREWIYDRLRPVARSLLAIMYFYGIFHKINTDFLDPNVSCAVSLYVPLAQPFGLENNLFGRYLAIYATFVVEAIAIMSLYWRKWFAVGLILAVVFHFVIPISAYSWYMDFSSLVFALYFLTMPKPASEAVYFKAIAIVKPLRVSLGRLGVLVPALIVALFAVLASLLVSLQYPARAPILVYHSVWIVIWAVLGGIAMVAMTAVALRNLPYRELTAPARTPLWPLALPLLYFLSCLSPYVGLKTESAITMFSNLHTEGGETNHLLFPTPPYMFDYQRDLVKIEDSSSPWLMGHARKDNLLVLFALKEYLRQNPQHWVSYTLNGETIRRATSADFVHERAGMLERNLLLFKPVDFQRPKVCTH